MNSFSKICVDDLVDEDDERQAIFKKANTRYGVAENSYFSNGSNQEALRLFTEAESVLLPLLEGGNNLTMLRAPELELLLKGRLHQAVITAQLEEIPNRWPRVKSLVQDVLQFDFGNCHARWVRGLSLLHGFGQRADAKDEMRRAIECARSGGKGDEADQWEAEMRKLFSEAEPVPTVSAETAQSVPVLQPIVEPTPTSATPTEGERLPAPSRPANARARRASGSRTEGSTMPAMKKGFLSRTNRSSKELPPDPPASPVNSSRDAEHEEILRKVEENRSLLDQQETQEQELQRRLESLQIQAQQLRESRRREVAWQQQLVSKVVEVESEFEGRCTGLLIDRKKSSQEYLASVHGSVSETKKRLQSIQSWGDSGQKMLNELLSDVQTVRELYEVEAKGGEETKTEQVQQVSEVTEQLGDVNGYAELLRARVRLLRGADSFYRGDGFDAQHFADIAADFSVLPIATKFWAFFDDAFVLRFAAFGLTAGMMLGLGVCVEFGPSFL